MRCNFCGRKVTNDDEEYEDDSKRLSYEILQACSNNSSDTVNTIEYLLISSLCLDCKCQTPYGYLWFAVCDPGSNHRSIWNQPSRCNNVALQIQYKHHYWSFSDNYHKAISSRVIFRVLPLKRFRISSWYSCGTSFGQVYTLTSKLLTCNLLFVIFFLQKDVPSSK